MQNWNIFIMALVPSVAVGRQSWIQGGGKSPAQLLPHCKHLHWVNFHICIGATFHSCIGHFSWFHLEGNQKWISLPSLINKQNELLELLVECSAPHPLMLPCGDDFSIECKSQLLSR